ncbi:hypothetical protein FGO68_gene1385 [Halteria grandinella]|uniref:Protein kinase domain-containing protein n=1 Tax=Halteria grandinella TaxID=5974 RepID=A0A8J8NPK0_HALGN|nr:hypothetical protein FGO68_gene1385 [Halteria grandinella]
MYEPADNYLYMLSGERFLEELLGYNNHLSLQMLICYHILTAKGSAKDLNFSNLWIERYENSLKFSFRESKNVARKGNDIFKAPEVLQGNHETNKKSAYSLGMMLFIVITSGLLPFNEDTLFYKDSSLLTSNYLL